MDEFLCTVEYDYPQFHLTMHCYWCSLKAKALHLNEHEAAPNLGFYIWAFTLSIMTGITLRNIHRSEAGVLLLAGIAVTTFVISFVQFGIGRLVGHWLGERVNSGQAMFQKNTALSIWVSYMYLHPVASVGAGCYVLWQNIINSLELWYHNKTKVH